MDVCAVEGQRAFEQQLRCGRTMIMLSETAPVSPRCAPKASPAAWRQACGPQQFPACIAADVTG